MAKPAILKRGRGRPATDPKKVMRVEEMARSGKTYDQIRAKERLSLGTISRIVNEAIERERAAALEGEPPNSLSTTDVATPEFSTVGATPDAQARQED